MNKVAPLIFIGAAMICGCRTHDEKKEPATAAPAIVEGRVQESELSSIRLTLQAEKRLGIQTVPVEIVELPRSTTYPGEAMIPPGRAIQVMAPVAGLIKLPMEQTAPPQSGAAVSAGQPIFMLIPGAGADGDMIAASDRITLAKARSDVLAAKVEAEGRVNDSRVRSEVAKARLERAQALHQGNAGSRKAVDEARAELELGHVADSAASDRLAAVNKVLSDLDERRLEAIAVRAPFAGRIRAIQVAPGQVVPSGAQLVEVVAVDPIWIRVPVYVGDVSLIRPDAVAEIRSVAARPSTHSVKAERVYPPGSADPTASTVDLVFAAANPDGRFAPGERVSVSIKSHESKRGPAVPVASILFDIDGGAWVYEQSAPNTYRRTRVAVDDIFGGLALLARGPAPGTKVVTTGAAELFGTEFGAGH